MNPTTPLFIPLKREYFEAFKRGEKTVEYRLLGPRWNERTCTVGRPVTLSLGYGKAHRLQGIITGFGATLNTSRIPGWSACYGNRKGYAACIEINVSPKP